MPPRVLSETCWIVVGSARRDKAMNKTSAGETFQTPFSLQSTYKFFAARLAAKLIQSIDSSTFCQMIVL